MGSKGFQIISKLGEGSFSSVWKVKRLSDGQEYAMKKVKMAALSEKEKQNALNEVRILASIKNPFIVGYKEAFFEDNSMTLCIVMEYAAGGDIYNKIVQHQRSRTYFKEDEIWSYAIQMIIGLKTLHDMKILHRDLKSANVFISKDGKSVKLGDLNVSKVAKTNLVYTQTGTPYYASPEVWRDQPYDSKSDIWSLGCVIYEMCALKPPFRANDMQGLNKRIQKGIFDKIPSQYSSDLNNLISLCLQVTPSLRPSCDKLLNHPLILKHGKDVIQNLEDIAEANQLLGTIQLPRNIKAIADKLPKPNYEDSSSEDADKKGLNKSEENERNLPSRRVQRAHSHQIQKVENRNIVQKPPSRQYRVPSRQKQPEIDNSDEKRQEIERPKPVSDRPRNVANQEEEAKISSEKAKQKRLAELLEANVPKRRPVNPSENQVEKKNIPSRQDVENLNPNERIERPRNYERRKAQGVLQERGYSEQDYLLNRYLNINPQHNKYNYRKDLDRMTPDRDDYISKRAENIVRKYYADAALAEKREPLVEIKPVNGTPPNHKDALDILQRYNNAYNLQPKEPVISKVPSRQDQYNRIDYADPNQYRNENRRYLNNENQPSNLNNLRQQNQQMRGVVRPSWWG